MGLSRKMTVYKYSIIFCGQQASPAAFFFVAGKSASNDEARIIIDGYYGAGISTFADNQARELTRAKAFKHFAG